MLKDFNSRLRASIPGSVNAFAKKCGMGESLIRKYLDGPTLPGVENAAKMAAEAEISLEWLITGVGEKQPSGGAVATSGPIDEALLQDVITAIEELLFERGVELTPAKKARAIALAFELFQEDGAVDRETVIQLIQLAA